MLWHPAYVGLGSNLDDPAAQVRRALAALGEMPGTRLVRRSSLYGSKPMGPVAQPDYVNAVAGLLTQLEVADFFARLRELERSLGRVPPREYWGPRRIDLDLLQFAQLRLDGEQLRLPHPGIVERNFVLYPLAEVAPELPVPGFGLVAELVARVSPEGIWRLDT
ncbi:MAG TPA: 2-amino-4-hydroxy-6-hydroxymethyldihydropteridine diphosphokinase [Steroidobacteraceae bacterium]|jgi:2-amino-4-hydroxy-6-hydroxymethyldihydropteridine diphosphokinase|nr:2-amino-4-hydroxy-6-hydroxymethyldihydropteridine diphosphokinase [Steroidobacteraceae bacterium]